MEINTGQLMAIAISVAVLLLLYFVFLRKLFKNIVTVVRLLNIGINTYGKIVEVKTQNDGEGNITYSPVIAYTDDRNLKYTHQPAFITYIFKPRRGQEVKIKYHPQNPQVAFVNTLRFYATNILIIVFHVAITWAFIKWIFLPLWG